MDEWNQIQPHPINYRINDKSRPLKNYKSHYVLPKNTWSPILAEHFWVHTQLACCLSFQRAKVYVNGTNYIKVDGRCTICDSIFKGIISKKPSNNAR